MNPKQKRIHNVIKQGKKNKLKKYFLGLILLVGFIKLISLGLEYLQ